jgi:2,3,4,5-tetrahydropyridine-2,6-dicarboxylate N-succinyltransferase
MTLAADVSTIERLVAEATDRLELLDSAEHRAAVEQTIAALDCGELRMAEKVGSAWVVHSWVQQAILLYFRITEMRTMRAGPIEYHDRIPLKQDLARRGIRVVPGGVARYGAHLEPGVVLMPGFVNIGARIGTGSMVDTWATVGSGAQIGRNVHLSGGVGIGGVLEPVGAQPVIIEDDAFIGSRCVIVEGVIVETGAVVGAQVALSASTHIIDVTGDQPVTYRGRVPARSIVVPGSRTRTFPAGNFPVSCALIIGRRNERTNEKLRPMDAARAFDFTL